MKRLLILWLAMAPALAKAYEPATQDTTIVIENRKFVVKEDDGKIRVKIYEEIADGDTIKNDQIFEGVYLDGQTMEQRFSVSIPFVKKEKNKSWWFDPHIAGFYIGYNRLYDGMSFSDGEADLVASKSWEWGLNLWDGSLNLSHNWAIASGLGFGYTSYRIDGGKALYRVDGETILMDAPEESTLSKSRLRYYHFRLPIVLEWQQRINRNGPLFFSFGPEIETRMWARSKAKVDGKKKTLARDLNTHPVGINLLAQAGYGDWGFYARYSTANLFESGKGPKLYPFSMGICWYW